MRKGLVSIITPCYNTGTYIHRLFDSILMQDYPHISMLVVDDGSTDNSHDIILSYIPKFTAKGYGLEYHFQANAGQSAAINEALKWVDGEFLVWPDSDDWYTSPHAISTMVQECSKSNRVGLVRCLYREYDENLKLIASTVLTKDISAKDQFENCITGEGGYYYCPGEYMLRMDVLDEMIPGRDIYTEKIAGQNWQIMLPVLYQRDCITIPQYMYGILVRHNSHSHSFDTYEEASAILNGYIRQLHSTLDNIADIPSTKLAEYKKETEKKYLLMIFIQAVIFGKKENAKDIRKQLEELEVKNISKQWILRYYLCHYSWFRSLIRTLRKFR